MAEICKIDSDVLLKNSTQIFDMIVDIMGVLFSDYGGDFDHLLRVDGVDYCILMMDELILAE